MFWNSSFTCVHYILLRCAWVNICIWSAFICGTFLKIRIHFLLLFLCFAFFSSCYVLNLFIIQFVAWSDSRLHAVKHQCTAFSSMIQTFIWKVSSSSFPVARRLQKMTSSLHYYSYTKLELHPLRFQSRLFKNLNINFCLLRDNSNWRL